MVNTPKRATDHSIYLHGSKYGGDSLVGTEVSAVSGDLAMIIQGKNEVIRNMEEQLARLQSEIASLRSGNGTPSNACEDLEYSGAILPAAL